MTSELSKFATRLRELISNRPLPIDDRQFSELALELFTLQFVHNPAYRKICEARGATPDIIEHWWQIPAVPTSAFKELELSCIPPNRRTTVFHSSGTTEQRPSRHFHDGGSLAVYETSLWSWFTQNIATRDAAHLIILTPPPAQAPHSSLVHMLDAVRKKFDADESTFVGCVSNDGAWTLNFDAVLETLTENTKTKPKKSALLFGTAFSFVHLLDFLAEKNLRIQLPPGSRVMETGGYKSRSRVLPKAELHSLITVRLGVPSSHIICEYGMSELSSQAYAGAASDKWQATSKDNPTHHFHFPPWCRTQIISPETGRAVAGGETGLIRVFDLANVFSVLAIQTEDLAVRHSGGFELIGRAQLAEPRGCSLMAI